MFRKIFALYTALFISLVSLVSIPPSQAAETCVGTNCEVIFNYTGGPQTWTPPMAARNIIFDVQGASGGRGGGFGGRVTGKLGDSAGTVLIYVGGAGTIGANAAGGFNGGGRAGGHRNNEGSGGGSSDIRSSESLESRIVVAGGGGGTGGYSGGPGGHGGNLVAGDGSSGQGSGGLGGTQTAGGLAGVNNGGTTPASAGSFGQGGSGGFSLNAGGGGGGGGWYGGGGGGSDDDDCCGDGGGGGGGSSYASPSRTQDVQHSSGFRQGNGIVIIRYELVVELVRFSGTQYSTNGASFELEYSAEILDLTKSDFVVSGEGCEVTSTMISLNKASIDVQGCLADPTLELIPDSIQVMGSQPAVTLSAQVLLDKTPPTMSLSATTFSRSDVVVEVLFIDAVNSVSSESFSVMGCESMTVDTATPAVLTLGNCDGPTAEISVAAGALVDQFGNTSNTISSTIFVDLLPASVEWLVPRITYAEEITFELALSASEQVSVLSDAITWSPSTAGCLANFADVLVLNFAGCQEGQLEISLLPNSVMDSAGHLSPASTLSYLVTLARPPIPTNPSTFNPPIAAPNLGEDVPEAPPLQPEPVSEIVEQPVAEESAEPSNSQEAIEPIQNQAEDLDSASSFEETSEELEQLPADDSKNQELAISAPKVVLAGNETVARDSMDWYLAIAAVIALLAVGGIGTYVFRLAENNRSRSIE